MPSSGQKDPTRTEQREQTSSVKDVRQETIASIFERQTVQTNPFGHNVSADNIYRRSERLAAAVHLVTAHVPEKEPIRSTIRKESINLLTLILALRNELRALRSEKVKKAQVSVRKLISETRLLSAAGFISTQNAQVFTSAFDELGVLLGTAQRSVLADDFTITRDDFMSPASEMPQTRRDVRDRTVHKQAESTTGYKEVSVKDSKRTDEVGNRSDRILGMLASGGLLSIKDIAVNLPEYSEKMIQRELANLVSENRVRKIGAKRWSRYELVQ